MPGYLTHVMVLIETEKWLSELERKLSDKKTASGGSLPDLEAKALDLATKARQYLRFVPPTEGAVLPPASPAEIKNKIGDGISQYAYSGSIGPDFPGAAYIFALYQRWVHETMHKGSPRRAWVKAGSTEFVINFIDSLNEIAAQEQRRPMMSYIIGHLSSIAAHVILRPFVNLVVWEREKIGRREFEVAIDASIVQWYFGKDDLNSPQELKESWADYFLRDGDAIDRLMERYFKAFEKTYKSAEPLETLCALPSVKKLKSDFFELESSHFKSFPGLEEALARYPGYNNLLKRFDGLEKKLDESPANKKFKDFLDDYEGRFAKLDRDMLVDGYKNTVNWAIDQGYDQGKPWLFRILWILLVLGGGALVIFMVWNNTQNFSTTSNNNPADVEEIKKLNRDAWQEGGFFANGRMWMDAIETSGMWSGLFFTIFNFLITGPPVIPWNGIFGQGIPDRHFFPKLYSFLKFIIFTVGGAILTDLFPGVFQKTEARVVKLLLSLGADGGSLAITLTEGNEEKGIQGDKLGAELWKAQYILHLIYLVSCMFAFGVKSTRTATTGSARETDPNWQDYMLGVLFFPAVGAILVGEGVLDSFLLERTASVTWPNSNTGPVKAFLPTKNNDAGKVVLDPAKAVKFPVSLFKGDQLPADGDRKLYPEADADVTPWAERPAKDEEARKKAGSSGNSPEKTYWCNTSTVTSIRRSSPGVCITTRSVRPKPSRASSFTSRPTARSRARGASTWSCRRITN
jgi:hypothetical protein